MKLFLSTPANLTVLSGAMWSVSTISKAAVCRCFTDYAMVFDKAPPGKF